MYTPSVPAQYFKLLSSDKGVLAKRLLRRSSTPAVISAGMCTILATITGEGCKSARKGSAQSYQDDFRAQKALI